MKNRNKNKGNFSEFGFKRRRFGLLFDEFNFRVRIFLALFFSWFVVFGVVLGVFRGLIILLVFCLIFFIIILYGYLIFLEYRKKRCRLVNQLLCNFETQNRGSLFNFPLPVAVCSNVGTLLWYNDRLKKALGFEKDFAGVDFLSFLKHSLKDFCVDEGVMVSVVKKHFKVRGSYFEKSRVFVLLFEDVTGFVALRNRYYSSRVCVLYFVIDNYREILTNRKESEKSAIVGRVDDLIESFVDCHGGIMQKYREDEFLIILNSKSFNEIAKNKFKILQIVKDSIKTEKKCELTLSIGAGCEAESFLECKKLAFQALDMALGRGGDQAVVKTPTLINFYGGSSRELYKSSRVKARVVARALLELVKTASNVLIMGHKFGDLDSCGSAIGLALALKNFKKSSFVAVNKSQNLSKMLFEKVSEAGNDDLVVDSNFAVNMIEPETLLIIVDTHNLSLLDSVKVYESCKNVVVIDHHRKTIDCVKNSVIFYHEPYASSTSELVCELIQQFCDENLIGVVGAQALLAGIMLDTKNFSIKVGVRTFEAAAYLKRLGADTVEVKKLFSSSIESYYKRSKIVIDAQIYKNCAISVSQFKTSDMRVIAAQAADDLLSIVGVEASFVIYELDDITHIAARSLGKFNVQLIMEHFKGGGHQLQAACQIKDFKPQRVYDLLVEAIDGWLGS